jgi:L-2-hydroxyglutarate oxidase
MSKRIAIVGGGLIGLATAYKLLLRFPGSRVDLYEKEPDTGYHQSGRNSGVLHCGLYYQPGSLKAKLAVDGIKEMTDFCRKHEVNHEICGKIVVATTTAQISTLRELAKRGAQNGLEGLRFLSETELKHREPFVASRETLLVPQEGIADYREVMNRLTELIRSLGGRVLLNTPVNKVKTTAKGEIIIHSPAGDVEYDRLINCTGLFSDRTFARFTGKKRPIRIVPFRGEYLKLKESASDMVKHLIYPVPDINYPFLGVHFTRMVSGEKEVGPNAVLAFKREGYTNRDVSVYDMVDSLTYIGLIRFLQSNFRFAMGEFYSSLSMKSFIRKAKSLIPEINEDMLTKGNAGVRAQALDRDGRLMMDFRIERVGNQIHVLNAPSPGATASLSIAGYIIQNYLTDLN